MKRFIYFSVLVLIFISSVFTIQDVFATNYIISESSCQAIGGTWSGGAQCYVSSLTISSGDTLTINSGIQLFNTGILFNHGNIDNKGLFFNYGIINNYGAISNNKFATIFNESHHLIQNFGTLNNNDTIDNNGIINNQCGATYSGNPTSINPINNITCSGLTSVTEGKSPDKDTVVGKGGDVRVLSDGEIEKISSIILKLQTMFLQSNDQNALKLLSELVDIWNKPSNISIKEEGVNKTSEGSSNEEVWNQPASSKERPAVPEWIKKNADWYGNGQITENDFVQGLEWMINNGVIRMTPAHENTHVVQQTK